MRPARLKRLVGHLSVPLAKQAAWVGAPFATQQIFRLATNIILARLLAPEFFGLMLLVNTLRTGAELLSDIGIGQSVVRSPHGNQRQFLDVAWTLQVLRGAGLTILMLIAAAPIAKIYGQPELLPIMLVVSSVFLISGLFSPMVFVVQRHIRLKTRAALDVSSIIFQCIFTIVLAYFMASVWALVWGLVASTCFSTAISYLVRPRYRPKFAWHPSYVLEIFHFGKWIFLSTAIYFAAASYDRLYFVGVLPLALAGIFAIARTFSDLVSALAQRAGSYLVFPKVAALGSARGAKAFQLRSTRRNALVFVAIATGLGMAVSDQFILFAYDERYHAAAFMIPLLLFGAWFGIISSFADSMLMGCGRPAPGAAANAAKFGVMLAGLPMAIAEGRMFLALCVLIVAELARWLALMPASRSEGFSRLSDDVLLTGVMAFSALSAKWAFGALGLVPSFAEWWALRELAHV